MSKLSLTGASDTVLIIERRFAAPRLLVWRTFSDPSLLSQWWGPENFTIPRLELDFRPGGLWLSVLRGPDGTELTVRYRYIEILAPERIVYRAEASNDPYWKGNPPTPPLCTFTLEDLGAETRLALRAEFPNAAAKADGVTRGFAKGTEQSLARLGRLLEAQSASSGDS